MLVFIGTYTKAPSRGIYGLSFDPLNGALSEPWLAAEARNPTFLEFARGGTRLYATGESAADPRQGCIGAFAVDPAAGLLERLNEEPTGPGGTTHVAVDATGRMAGAASYSGGYVCALPILGDGRVGPPSSRWEPSGPLGPNRVRQDKPHPHSITFGPDNLHAVACDLGLDRVLLFTADPARALLSPADPSFVPAPPGAGPRHSKFSGDGRHLYVANEMGGSVCAYAFDPASGSASLLQTISTLPAGFTGENNVGEIRIHPGGRFVYVSNRGHDSLAAFIREPGTGLLSPVEIVPCGGRHPRHFALSPDGRWLLCANRDTGNVVVHVVNLDTGRLRPAGREAAVPEPVCVAIHG